MELSNAIQTGRSSRVARVGDEKNSKGLMQNGSMGVGSLGVARGDMAVWGRSTFHLLSSDRTKTQTYLDQWNLEDLKGKSPRQVKNCLGGYGKEDEAESQSKGRGERGRGQAVLQQAEQWTSSEKRQILCQVDSGSRNWSQAAESLCRAFQKSLCHLLLPQSNPSENRGQDSQELCCENKVLAEYARGDHEKVWAYSKTLWDNSRGPLKCWDKKTGFFSYRSLFSSLHYSLPIQSTNLEYFLFFKALSEAWTTKAKAVLVAVVD